MGDAKRLIVQPISSTDANRVVKALHYSGKVVQNSQIHLGVFLDGRCGGAMQFGPSMDKRHLIALVRGTTWNEFIELNRLAFADWLPRNSESRAIAYMLRWIKRTYPWIEWVQSYADATQCGDGTIYRAAGFLLVSIRPNASMYRMPDGNVVCKIVFEPGFSPNSGPKSLKARYGKTGGGSSHRFLKDIGAERLAGFQLRYVAFLHPAARARLAYPVLDYAEIARRGAGMYRGHRVESAESGTSGSTSKGRCDSDLHAPTSEDV